MPSGKTKRTGSSRNGKNAKNKRKKLSAFLERHIDQVWEDVRKESGVHDGKVGPRGTLSKVELDEDVPGHGKFYCLACSRYFTNERAQADHERSKDHKRRIKELMGARPHNQGDAEWAAGMGPPDNGPAADRRAAAAMVE